MRRVCLSLGVVVFTATAVQADLAARSDTAALIFAVQCSSTATLPDAAQDIAFCAEPSIGFHDDSITGFDPLCVETRVSSLLLAPRFSDDHSEGASPPRIIQLPAAPRGDVLCLSGLLSIGALQLARRARGLCLGLPSWYQPDAPPKICHTTLLDPRFDTGPATVQAPLTPPVLVVLRPAALTLRSDGPPLCPLPRATAPRAPPA